MTAHVAEMPNVEIAPRSLTRRVAWVVVLVAVLLGVLLRLLGIESKSLWGDEIASLAFSTGHFWIPPQADTEAIRDANHYRASLSLSPTYFSQRLLTVLQTDTLPPLYYFLLNLWMHLFGTSEAALRSLSMLASLGSIPVVFVLGRWLATVEVGVVSALMFAVAPFQVAFGQYNRQYALLGFLALLSTYAAVRLCDGKGEWKGFLLYAGSVILGLYTHYLFIWNVLCHWILVTLSQRHNHRFLWRWLLIQVGLGVAVLPLVWLFLAQLRWQSEAETISWFYWHTGTPSLLHIVLYVGRNVVFLLSVGRIRGLCPSSGAAEACALDVIATGAFYLFAAAVIGFAVWTGIAYLRPKTLLEDRRTNFWGVCVLWGLCIFGGPLVLDLLTHAHSLTIHRYYIAASGPLYLAVAFALCSITRPRIRTFMVSAVLVFLLAGSVLYLRGFSGTLIHEQGIREVTRDFDQLGHDDDLIVVLNPLPNPMDLAYYLRSNPAFARIDIPGWSRSSSDIPTQLQTLTRDRPRVWYLDDHGPEAEARETALTWLHAHYNAEGLRNFKGLDLYLFTP